MAKSPRNLVVCCDGTHNEVVGNQSNVLRLFRMLERSDGQLTCYDAGWEPRPSGSLTPRKRRVP